MAARRKKKKTARPARKVTGPSKPEGLGPKTGRPPMSKERLRAVLTRIKNGEALVNICKDKDLPSAGTVMDYANKDSSFSEEYEHALKVRADVWADQVVTIPDEATPENVAVARLRVDARKWVASRLIPHRYGDRQAIEVSGPSGGPITFADLARKAAK